MVREDLETYEDNKVLRVAMNARKMRQQDLAEKLGMLQSSISGNLNRSRMGLEVFVKMLDAMDYDVVVVDRRSREEEWKVGAQTD